MRKPVCVRAHACGQGAVRPVFLGGKKLLESDFEEQEAAERGEPDKKKGVAVVVGVFYRSLTFSGL
ncbi:hypothetical protein JOB18_030711 [Solea senegalensis]|uniref:Uncharacterized protein n=1 Tax=Solea senegalensis TaxID=28829 RepID=A0AAV6QGD8_SOLSE|nr:hypothetical protein JOB18_030711 [Solea senegalensis]